ncbi:MAG: hypothetical protein FIA95_03580, partial [Gemmatimonadetes bacterium]|nr:hypothetical protein [Gemmatimonadota bacterium]
MHKAMLTFTDRARDVVRSYLDGSGGDLQALRVTPQAGSPVAPRFELSLVPLSEKEAGEIQLDGPGFPVLVRMGDSARLEGAVVDFVERGDESGFEVRLAGTTPPAPLP